MEILINPEKNSMKNKIKSENKRELLEMKDIQGFKVINFLKIMYLSKRLKRIGLS